MRGVALATHIPMMAMMIAAGILGNWIGGKVLNRIPERGCRIVFRVLLTLPARRLTWKAAAEAGIL